MWKEETWKNCRQLGYFHNKENWNYQRKLINGFVSISKMSLPMYLSDKKFDGSFTVEKIYHLISYR